MNKIKLAIPKGSLEESTLDLFKKAGFTFVASGRSYILSVDDDEIEALLIRPQEIPRYVEDGVLDLGISGYDWICENGSDVVELADLLYSKTGFYPVKIVVAVHQDSALRTPADLAGQRIATEYVGLTQRWLGENGASADVEFSHGACEVKIPELADAIVVNTETGSSIRAHNLKVIHKILESTPRLIANRDALQDPWKRQKAESLAMLLQGALRAAALVGLKLNVSRASLSEVLSTLPAMKNPTVSPLADHDWVAVETILDRRLVRDLIPKLKRAGAQDIVEYPLNKVIY
ncbi:MAG: ATP phosphoribosyltransferase [Chloroflexi bacterium]|nr:ATP phosphoribosyltransferase [Chloroflexota bacterium]